MSEDDYLLGAVLGVAGITLVFALFMYLDAVEVHRNTFGVNYETRNRLFGGTYQVVMPVWPTELGLKVLLAKVFGPSLVFFVGYTLLARVVLLISNGLGGILDAVRGYEPDFSQIEGGGKYIFAVIWPVLLIYVAFQILAIIFVFLFRIIWIF